MMARRGIQFVDKNSPERGSVLDISDTPPIAASPCKAEQTGQPSIDTAVRHSRSAPQLSTEANAPQADAELTTFFRALISIGVPEPRKAPTPQARQRVWLPNQCANATPPGGKFFGRHPELDWAFLDIEARHLGRRRGRAGSRGIRGKFFSRVTNRTMHSTSDLEFDAFRRYELEPRAIRFIEQPVRLRFDLGGRWRTCTPDLYVEYGDCAEFVEIKFEDEARIPENEERWKAIGETMSMLGYGYRVLTERHLRCEPRHSNTDTIFRARHVQPATVTIRDLIVSLERCGSLTIATIVDQFRLTEKNIYCLIRLGHLATDLDAGPLGPQTLIHLRAPGRH